MGFTSEKKISSSPPFFLGGEHRALDFANTLLAANGEPVEMLKSVGDVLYWLKAVHLGAATEHLSFKRKPENQQDALLEQIRSLRALWKTSLEKLATGKEPGPQLLEALNHILKDDLSCEVIARSGRENTFHLGRAHLSMDPERKLPALIAHEIADFLAQADLKYLRRCAGPDCVVYFYDTTKNHRRQWCSVALCGNRHKVAAFRQRQSRKKT